MDPEEVQAEIKRLGKSVDVYVIEEDVRDLEVVAYLFQKGVIKEKSDQEVRVDQEQL